VSAVGGERAKAAGWAEHSLRNRPSTSTWYSFAVSISRGSEKCPSLPSPPSYLLRRASGQSTFNYHATFATEAPTTHASIRGEVLRKVSQWERAKQPSFPLSPWQIASSSGDLLGRMDGPDAATALSLLDDLWGALQAEVTALATRRQELEEELSGVNVELEAKRRLLEVVDATRKQLGDERAGRQESGPDQSSAIASTEVRGVATVYKAPPCLGS
jgi:hypothetical protein